MRYLIEESSKGKFMIHYTKPEDLPEVDSNSEEVTGTVEILRVWQPTHITHVKEDDIEEYGVTIKEMKDIIANCLSKANYPTGWIQADILNVM